MELYGFSLLKSFEQLEVEYNISSDFIYLFIISSSSSSIFFIFSKYLQIWNFTESLLRQDKLCLNLSELEAVLEEDFCHFMLYCSTLTLQHVIL